MKFEIFNDKGVLQPIEFILAFIYTCVLVLIGVCAMESLSLYLPWWTDNNMSTNGLTVVLLLGWLTK